MGARAMHTFDDGQLDVLCALLRSGPAEPSLHQVHFDSRATNQSALLSALVAAEAAVPSQLDALTFPGRRITFPIVLDDRWNRDALARYMRSTRSAAAYLPSNVDYLARNNGLRDGAEALRVLVGTDWLTLGVGFYLACPFLVPVRVGERGHAFWCRTPTLCDRLTLGADLLDRR